MTMTMKILVTGKVSRQVLVEGNSVAECEANAITEWAALTGGDYTTAEPKVGVVMSKETQDD
tara:strand:+ start:523 stop:708 length:186 start_codon:yes stop_codon:yes gene_type:complete